MRFLAIGECMAELAPASSDAEYRLGFAGDTFNTAWYLARLSPELDVALFTAIGTDRISQQMRATVLESGIEDQFIQGLDDLTLGLYLISLNNGERSFSYWRGQSAARQMLRDKAFFASALDQSDIIYFSGITLAILDQSQRETLIEGLKAARSAGKIIVFDPNLRPRLWDDTTQMTDVIMHGASVCDVALPSFEDEATWFNDADPEATLKRYQKAGASTVIVKNGADPVCYSQNAQQGRVAVTPLSKVVDTTAAGDSFNAEIISGLVNDTPIAQSIERACKLAASVVQGKGALVPINLDQIDS